MLALRCVHLAFRARAQAADPARASYRLLATSAKFTQEQAPLLYAYLHPPNKAAAAGGGRGEVECGTPSTDGGQPGED